MTRVGWVECVIEFLELVSFVVGPDAIYFECKGVSLPRVLAEKTRHLARAPTKDTSVACLHIRQGACTKLTDPACSSSLFSQRPSRQSSGPSECTLPGSEPSIPLDSSVSAASVRLGPLHTLASTTAAQETTAPVAAGRQHIAEPIAKQSFMGEPFSVQAGPSTSQLSFTEGDPIGLSSFRCLQVSLKPSLVRPATTGTSVKSEYNLEVTKEAQALVRNKLAHCLVVVASHDGLAVGICREIAMVSQELFYRGSRTKVLIVETVEKVEQYVKAVLETELEQPSLVHIISHGDKNDDFFLGLRRWQSRYWSCIQMHRAQDRRLT
mmetsp:Transcript_11062/g.34158  ORF Transcript_11062/g.34158 Transcript_11062/m.34158 type:complete len:323 (-) Transcript_11062:729-1697(-)